MPLENLPTARACVLLATASMSLAVNFSPTLPEREGRTVGADEKEPVPGVGGEIR
jgi:hypothetical protein